MSQVIAERFEILREAGAGGMSTVFQALDRASGRHVALKMLDLKAGDFAGRFQREAKALSELQHPGIVAYVDHGTTKHGQRYLAMEWLDGEDLAARITRAGLTIAESLQIGRAVAEAVGFAHARGLVHRDLKPSNLFLVDGRIDRVKLLDFGVVRVDDGGDMTRTGARVGTPAYMSPEQARGDQNLTPSADVFALGCVLYQCLTGRKPFTAEDPLALIAKIMLADPPPPAELHREIPAPVDALVMKMLSKDPALRPADGAAAAAALAALPIDPGQPGLGDVTVVPSSLTGAERRLVCVVMLRGVRSPNTVEKLRERAAELGARLDRISGDGTLVATMQLPGAATDLAAQAARLALALHDLAPGALVALATGRAVMMAGRLPVGEAIDRAARLLRTQFDDEKTQPIAVDAKSGGVVRIDETTAGLLDPRFVVGGDEGGMRLDGTREVGDTTRTLLGRPTPCVGREAELASIEALYVAAVDEGEARAVLVTAPAGVGKSRLRYELWRRLGPRDPAPIMLIGRGDPVRAGAPFGLLADAIRRAAGVKDDDTPQLKHARVRARLSRHLQAEALERAAEFVGELAGTPRTDGASVQLQAARLDPQLMGDQMRRAVCDWLSVECVAQPLVLVLEDLHWGDRPTVAMIDAVLRALTDRPLLVLALARPEVHQLFPSLWSERGVHEIRLHELSRKAAEKLVLKVLGDRPPSDVARLVDRAHGNAFYLEELIRAESEGRGAALPETVLAMTQARLESMEPDARQVLRAASVFGEVFWQSAVMALLGEKTVDVAGWLQTLERREVLSRRTESRFSGESELVFRHGLVREAAYAMLTDADRRIGHLLAADWLELAGETSAKVLAEHFERGGRPERASGWYRRAAEQALRANDFASVIECAEQGIRCGASGEALGTLKLLESEARGWRAEWPAAEAAGVDALKWLPSGSDAWFGAAGEVGWAAGSLGHREQHAEVARALEKRLDAVEPNEAALHSLARVAMQALYLGESELGERLYARLEKHIQKTDVTPSIAARFYAAQASQALFEGNPARFLELARAAVRAFAETGDLRSVCQKMGSSGYAQLEVGDYEAAVSTLERVLKDSERMGLSNIAATARQNLGLALARVGRLDEARKVEAAAMEAFRRSSNRRMESASRYYLALILSLAGELDLAEREARAAVEQASADPPLPPIQAEGNSILAQILLRRGRSDEAYRAARAAHDLLEQMGGIDGGEGTIRLVWAEALEAVGEREAARAAIAQARDKLAAVAARISDEDLRKSFLERVPDHARTLELAGRWL
jgi:tetratricopeptide (TPR) repeat protein